MCVYIRTYINIQMYIYISACLFVCMCVACLFVCMHVYTHSHTHTHTRIRQGRRPVLDFKDGSGVDVANLRSQYILTQSREKKMDTDFENFLFFRGVGGFSAQAPREDGDAE